MADIEKTQAHDVAEPPETPVAGSTHAAPKPSLRDRLAGRTNDPNELGKELLQKALEFDEAQLTRDAIKVRRKLDFIVVPMVCWEHVPVKGLNRADTHSR